MAMLDVGLLKSPSTILSFGYSSHNENKFLKRGVRLPSLRKGSHHIGVSVKCLKEELPLPSFNDTLTIPHPKDIATTLPYRPPPPPQVETYSVVRRDFPPDFKFGASTSALQTEGALLEGGRGPSTWDYFVKDPETGKEIAVDSYHKYKEDVKCLKEMGVNAYRFSISWSRILPKGRRSLFGEINKEGIEFYNNLINELIANGITPFVTLHHFDLPQALQDLYGGFSNPKIVNDFKAYADICFRYFGDRVKHWTTINEPQAVAVSGDKNARFVISHNIILAHAAAAKHYKENYQKHQKGEIGISLICLWAKPSSNSSKDISAAKRANDFMLGWYLNPLVYGDYPYIMKNLLGDDLPIFKEEDKELVKGAYDFIGVNYYTSRYADFTFNRENLPDPDNPPPSANDMFKIPYVNVTVKDGENDVIGETVPGSGNVYIYPDGLKESLIYIKNEYKDPKIYITENGFPENRDDSISLEKALEDDHRISFIWAHINALHEALKEGAKVEGYFIWSLMDCLECGSDYKVRMGLNFVDYKDDLKRHPKKSAKWLRHFLTDFLPPAPGPIHPIIIKPIPGIEK